MAVETQAAGTRNGDRAAEASAHLQRESKRFAALYESNAYVAYNLALRITGEQRAARAAAERAFLMRLGHSDSVTELVLAVVASARAEARERPRPGGAGSEEADQLLAAIAALPLAERVAIGMVSVDHGTPTKIGAALDLPAEQAGDLRTRAQKSFAEALGTTQAQAKERWMSWPWTQPPPEMWEPLYMQAYRALERGVLANGAGATPVAVAAPPHREDEGPSTPPAPKRSALDFAAIVGAILALPSTLAAFARAIFVDRSLKGFFEGRPSWMRRAMLVGAVGLPAVIAAMVVFGGGGSQTPTFNLNGGSAAGGVAGQPAPGSKGYKPLTPQELDKLRLNELNQLRKYSKQQQNRSLSFDQRRGAANRAAQLADIARRRLAATRLQQKQAAAQLKQQRIAQKNAAHHRAPPPPPPPPTPTPAKPPKSGGTKKPNYSNCLFDERTKTYVCPT